MHSVPLYFVKPATNMNKFDEELLPVSIPFPILYRAYVIFILYICDVYHTGPLQDRVPFEPSIFSTISSVVGVTTESPLLILRFDGQEISRFVDYTMGTCTQCL